MIPPRLKLAVAAGLVSCGCQGADEKSSPHIDEVRRDVASAAEAVVREATAQRDGAQDAIEQKLVELDRRLDEARRAAHSTRHAKESAKRRLRELEKEGSRLRERVDEARRAGTRAVGEIEQSLDRALQEIETAWGASEDPAHHD